MGEKSISWKNPRVSDEFRERMAAKLAAEEALCRKATPAQKLAYMRASEQRKLPGWLENHRESFTRWVLVAWEGGANRAEEVSHLWVAFGGEDSVGRNKRKVFYEHFQAFLDILNRG